MDIRIETMKKYIKEVIAIAVIASQSHIYAADCPNTKFKPIPVDEDLDIAASVITNDQGTFLKCTYTYTPGYDNAGTEYAKDSKSDTPTEGARLVERTVTTQVWTSTAACSGERPSTGAYNIVIGLDENGDAILQSVTHYGPNNKTCTGT